MYELPDKFLNSSRLCVLGNEEIFWKISKLSGDSTGPNLLYRNKKLAIEMEN